MLLAYLLAVSCNVDDSFSREDFENKWWEVQQYPVCFNFHYYEESELLIYEHSIRNEGTWEFLEPNRYEVSGEVLFIESNEGCWVVDGYKGHKVDACECTLIPWEHSMLPRVTDLIKPVSNKSAN